MRTVGAPGAFLHSPTTTGWPAVGYIFAGTPILSSDAFTHSAARFVSPLWSDFALTLGMRNKSKSSLRIRASLSERNFSISRGIPPAPLPPLLIREPLAPVTLVAEGLAPELLTVLVDFVIDSDSLAFSFSYKMCD